MTPCLLLPITVVLTGIEFLISIQTNLHLLLCPTQCPKTSGQHLTCTQSSQTPSRFSLLACEPLWALGHHQVWGPYSISHGLQFLLCLNVQERAMVILQTQPPESPTPGRPA